MPMRLLRTGDPLGPRKRLCSQRGARLRAALPRFYASARVRRDSPDVYLRNARYCYLRWGADGKVRQLEELYPHLREEEPAPGPTSTIGDAGRTPRSRDRDQGVASRLGRDRPRKADRHAHAHRDRAGGRRARLVDPAVRDRAADRGGSRDQRRYGDRASARRARDRGRAAGVGSPLCRAHPTRASFSTMPRPSRRLPRIRTSVSARLAPFSACH